MNELRTHLLFATLAASSLLLAGCGLTPKQLQALDGAMCTRTAFGGGENTTVVVGGASRAGAIAIDGATCSIATRGGSTQ